MAQMPLFDPITTPVYEPRMTIRERFDAFDEANPHVKRRLTDMAMELWRRGTKHYGMKALYEVLRYEYTLRTSGDSFKLNNNYTALYARKIMLENPELDGFFSTRKRRSRSRYDAQKWARVADLD